MKTPMLLAVMLSLITPALWGQTTAGPSMDGNELHTRLENFQRIRDRHMSTEDSLFAFSAAGYVEGVTDAFNNDLFCVPSGVTPDQLIAVTMKFLDKNPAIWQRPAVELVGAALTRAFPCGKK